MPVTYTRVFRKADRHVKTKLTTITPTEAQEGSTLVAYLRVKNYRFTHIANETGSSPEAKRRAIRVKQQGVSRGFPDYLVITNAGLVAIELKRLRGSKLSPEQNEWVDALNAAGVPAKVCRGAQEAIDFITRIELGNKQNQKERVTS